MYRAVGQTTEKPVGDPFVFTSEKFGTCLKGTWPSYALLCAQAREGTLDPKFAPNQQVCSLFMDEQRRTMYSKLTICWEHGADPKVEETYKAPLYPWNTECGDAQRKMHVDDISACLKDPQSSERCALYAHPEIQALLATSCGADVYKMARKEAEGAELRKALLVGGGALLVGGAIYALARKR